LDADTTRFLHTSDWHLGAPRSKWPWPHPNRAAWVERLRSCREAAVRSVVELAVTNQVGAVLVAGDVLDQPELEKDVKARVERFARSEVVEPLRLHGIRLVLTIGSHDFANGCMLTASPHSNSALRKGRYDAPPVSSGRPRAQSAPSPVSSVVSSVPMR